MTKKDKKTRLSFRNDNIKRVEFLKINARGGLMLHIRGAQGFANTETFAYGKLIDKSIAPPELVGLADNPLHTLMDENTRKRYFKVETVERVVDTEEHAVDVRDGETIFTERGVASGNVESSETIRGQKVRGGSPEAVVLSALKEQAGIDQ